MEERIYTTIIRNCKNNFMIGKIMGIMEAICDPDMLRSGTGYAMYSKEFDRGNFETYIRVNTDYDRYCDFVEIVEKIYPGICNFDFNVEDDE